MSAKGSTTKLPRTCLYCGTEFLAYRFVVRQGRGIFCSQKCCNTYRNKAAASPQVEQTCLHCGSSFLVSAHVAEHGSRKYCSRVCYIGDYYGDDVEERFWSKVDRRGPDDCWEWQAGSFTEGYGAFLFRGTLWKASRVAWTLTNGEIPDDLWALHTCDNPPCCNPNHIYVGTALDNANDMVSRNRQACLVGEDRTISKLTEADVREIRIAYADGGVTQQELGDRFHVTFQNIHSIVRRKTWKHVA